MTLKETYDLWYRSPQMHNGDCSAFYQHMPTLRLLCRNKTVVELGARYGVSTLAILVASPVWLVSVDIELFPTMPYIHELAVNEGIDFTIITADDLTIEIPVCDILFIDTLHTYHQLSQELVLHGNQALQYIVFHDTVSFAYSDEQPTGELKKGLNPAINEFVKANSHWKEATHYDNCNGLTILYRNDTMPEV